ncbi:hypothetical protein [Pedobacter cryoconitis]|uniref:Uncharacterized protein n=1 Tax=Pedobacter cryoconitis TaxID=188932 RepID=A0A7X0J570_9SPHI|nr:hypothetical protein [Pedobacter cryoconitis]MBB6501083.1 hypothetical protein [Pedobacter cryoconitis]
MKKLFISAGITLASVAFTFKQPQTTIVTSGMGNQYIHLNSTSLQRV